MIKPLKYEKLKEMMEKDPLIKTIVEARAGEITGHLRAEALAQAGIISIDEAREMLGIADDTPITFIDDLKSL